MSCAPESPRSRIVRAPIAKKVWIARINARDATVAVTRKSSRNASRNCELHDVLPGGLAPSVVIHILDPSRWELLLLSRSIREPVAVDPRALRAPTVTASTKILTLIRAVVFYASPPI